MAAFILIDGTVFSIYAVASALWHEIWHIIVLKLSGGGVQKLTVRGFQMKLDITSVGYLKEAAVALAGPAASFIAFAVTAVCCIFSLTKPILFIAVSNLSLFIVNIMPVYPLDGGRALYCLLCRKLSYEKATKLTKTVSLIFLLPMSAAAVIILVRTGYNLSLMLICLYLAMLLMGIKEI